MKLRISFLILSLISLNLFGYSSSTNIEDWSEWKISLGYIGDDIYLNPTYLGSQHRDVIPEFGMVQPVFWKDFKYVVMSEGNYIEITNRVDILNKILNKTVVDTNARYKKMMIDMTERIQCLRNEYTKEYQKLEKENASLKECITNAVIALDRNEFRSKVKDILLFNVSTNGLL